MYETHHDQLYLITRESMNLPVPKLSNMPY